MLVVKQLLSTRNTNTNTFTGEGQKCESKGGLNADSWIKIPVPISTVKVHIITEFSVFFLFYPNRDLFFIWHRNEHKTRRDLIQETWEFAKKFLKEKIMEKCQRWKRKTAFSMEPKPGSNSGEVL